MSVKPLRAYTALTMVGRQYLFPCIIGIWIYGFDVTLLIYYILSRCSILLIKVGTNQPRLFNLIPLLWSVVRVDSV